MGQKDKRVDAYIAKSADFAKPILNRLRSLVHRGCPGVVETLKWGMPFFEYQGMLCMMAAFKKHCTFGFWKQKLLAARVKNHPALGGAVMKRFVRLDSLADLPGEKTLLGLLKEAVLLNESGVKMPKRRVPPAKDRALDVPEDFMKAVRADKKALASFEGGSHTFRKEYVLWVTDAKTQETRERRLKTAVTWMAQGKGRNWKYQ